MEMYAKPPVMFHPIHLTASVPASSIISMVNIKTNNGVNAVSLLTLPGQSVRVHYRKSCCSKSSGEELIMAINHASNVSAQSVMGFCYYCYFKACYFAGLFRRAKIKPLSCV